MGQLTVESSTLVSLTDVVAGQRVGEAVYSRVSREKVPEDMVVFMWRMEQDLGLKDLRFAITTATSTNNTAHPPHISLGIAQLWHQLGEVHKSVYF